jgi:multiple sugar transport system substrate-binding protein
LSIPASRRARSWTLARRCAKLLAALSFGLAHEAHAQGLPAATEPKTRRLSCWFNTSPLVKAFELDIRDFESANPGYAVDLTIVPEGAYTSTILSAGRSGELPCVLFIDSPVVPHFAWQGYLEPLDTFVPENLRADLLPSVLGGGSYGGRLYALGPHESGLGIFGNRRHLELAAVRTPTVEQPWTLAEFEDALERLARVPGVRHPLDLKVNYGRGEFFTYAFAPMIQSWGGDLVDREQQTARGAMDGPRSVAAMKRLQSWFDKGWANRRPADDNDFTSRRAALSWVGHWAYTRYAEALGDDLVLLPAVDFGNGPRTGSGAWMFAVTSGCHDKAGAWRLIELTLRRDKVLRWTGLYPSVPARRSALGGSALFGPGGRLHLYVQQLERGWAVPRPKTPAYPTISAAFAQAVEAIIAGADVQQALTKAASAIDDDVRARRGHR